MARLESEKVKQAVEAFRALHFTKRNIRQFCAEWGIARSTLYRALERFKKPRKSRAKVAVVAEA